MTAWSVATCLGAALVSLSSCVTTQGVDLREPAAVSPIPAGQACGSVSLYFTDERKETDPARFVDWLSYDDAHLDKWIVSSIKDAYALENVAVESAQAMGDSTLVVVLKRFYIEDTGSGIRTTLVGTAEFGDQPAVSKPTAIRGHHAGVVWIGHLSEYERQLKTAARDFASEIVVAYPVCSGGK